jgi:hypothetical protein
MILSTLVGCLLSMSTMGEQITVHVAPPREVVEIRGKAPHPGYVYQRGYHRWDGRTYVWTPGVWVAPPHPGAIWVDHRWEHRANDWVFVEGHWR